MSCIKRKKLARRAALAAEGLTSETTTSNDIVADEPTSPYTTEPAPLAIEPEPEAEDAPETSPDAPGDAKEDEEAAKVAQKKPVVKKKSYKQK